MSTTRTYNGATSLAITAQAAASGDAEGGETIPRFLWQLAWAAAGGDAPTLSGWVYAASVTCAAGDWEFAHATDPFGSMGDATPSPGFTPAGSKLKMLAIRNLDSTNSITLTRTTTTGISILAADGDAVTLAAGDWLILYKKAGTAALTNDSNDHLTISVGGGSPTCEVLALYGP